MKEAREKMFPTKILLASDGSTHSQLAARVVANFAAKTTSELHVVHVGFVPAMYHPEMRGYAYHYEAVEQETQRLLDEEVRQIEAAGSNVAQAHLRMGRPDTEVVQLAEELDAGLVAVGSRGLGGVRRALMCSVSDSVVRHAHCPVLVVRDEPHEAASKQSIEPADSAGI